MTLKQKRTFYTYISPKYKIKWNYKYCFNRNTLHAGKLINVLKRRSRCNGKTELTQYRKYVYIY